MATEAAILDVRFAPALTPERLGKDDAIVFYRIGAGPVLTVRLPREKYAEQAVKDAITKDQADAAKLKGRSITL